MSYIWRTCLISSPLTLLTLLPLQICSAFMITDFTQTLPGMMNNMPGDISFIQNPQWPTYKDVFKENDNDEESSQPEMEDDFKEKKDNASNIDESQVPKSRKKRAVLAWPANTTFISQFALQIPLLAPAGVIVPFTVAVPYIFRMPNVTKEFLFAQRSLQERLDIYGLIENLFLRLGLNGHSCLLRAICENAEYHILGNGIMGEIISLVLAISSAKGSHEYKYYLEAESHGRSNGDCWSKYTACPVSLFNWID